MKSVKKPNSAHTILAVALAVSSPLASAQPVLEEVLVTATKRPSGLQDVPVALSVMSGEKIAEQGLDSLEDLAIFMPNVHIAEAGGGDQLFIRGIGSGVNYGFEQSVGTFIDGVYFGRGQASRSTFLDVARVEILKGPQSALFGKNTIAGAINVTTAVPGDEFEGSIEAGLEPEFGHWNITTVLSGPVTDTLGARFVIKRDETDGYMSNTLLGQDEVQGKDTVARIFLGWTPSDDLDVRFKYETGESKRVGRQNMISIASATAIARYQTADPNFSPAFSYNKSMANVGDMRSDTDVHDSEWAIAAVTIDWMLGEHTLNSITGYVDYSFDNYLDVDYGPLAFLGRGRDENHEQFSQEFLLSSPTGGELEYLAGFYYQQEDLQHDSFTDAILSAAGIGNGNLDATGVGSFQQDAETWSTFVQLTWNASDNIRFIGGLRYSDDHKEFEKELYATDPFTSDRNQQLGGIYDQILNFQTDHAFNASGAVVCKTLAYVCSEFPDFTNQRDETHWTGDFTVQWDVTDQLMSYVKISNGYKAGGFDENNVRGRVDQAAFEDERVEGVEVGAKMDFWDGRARMNMAAFLSQFEDVQVSTFDGNSGFTVGNAAKAETRGVEIDGTVAVTGALTLSGGLAYLKADYKSFEDAACNEAQVVEWIAGGGTRPTCTQDLSGAPLQFAPEWSANLAAVYYLRVTDTLEMKFGLDAMYSDEYVVANDQDDNLNQDAYWKLNARIQLANIGDTWSLAVVGKNLTDEKTTVWGNDVPLAAQGFSGTYFQHIDAPRSFLLQARYNF